MPGAEISVQLYSVRGAIAEDLPGALRRVAALGFTNVELFGFVADAAEYQVALAETGLAAPSAHAQLVDLDDAGVLGVFDAAVDLGVRTVIDPMVAEERWTTRADVKATAARLGEIATEAATRGLAIGYHNHWWELAELDGRTALEVFAGDLSPEVVLEVDTYWAEVGGVRAADLLRRLGDRVRLIHVKDGPITRDTAAQQPAGQGQVPVEEILAASPGAMRVVEFDDYSGDIFAGLADSLAYLEGRA